MVPAILITVGLIFLYADRASAFTLSFDFFWPLGLVLLGLLAYLNEKRS
jgi:hypothetical protein